MEYKPQKKNKGNTLAITLLISFSLITGTYWLMYATYEKEKELDSYLAPIKIDVFSSRSIKSKCLV